MKKYKEVILQDGVTLYFDDNNCCEKIKIEKAWKISRRILVTSVVQLGGFNK